MIRVCLKLLLVIKTRILLSKNTILMIVIGGCVLYMRCSAFLLKNLYRLFVLLIEILALYHFRGKFLLYVSHLKGLAPTSYFRNFTILVESQWDIRLESSLLNVTFAAGFPIKFKTYSSKLVEIEISRLIACMLIG